MHIHTHIPAHTHIHTHTHTVRMYIIHIPYQIVFWHNNSTWYPDWTVTNIQIWPTMQRLRHSLYYVFFFFSFSFLINTQMCRYVQDTEHRHRFCHLWYFRSNIILLWYYFFLNFFFFLAPLQICLFACQFMCRYHAGKAYIIDVSQAVEHDHPNAMTFLRKDCTNITGLLSTHSAWFISC